MIIEVAGVSTRNKGAQLMLVAVQEHLAGRGEIELAVDRDFGTFRERAAYGLLSTLGRMGRGRSAAACALMPASFRRAYGLVAEAEIGVVLDASGFAFSDQFGPARTEQFARDVVRWKKQGRKIILLPQALGPFHSDRLRAAFATVLESVDLVFARDHQSYEYVKQVAATPKLCLAPDFTNLVRGQLREDIAHCPNAAFIVPNHRMLEKTSREVAGDYLPFLAQAIRMLKSYDLEPHILLHDSAADETLVSPLLELADEPIPVVREACPKRLKGILSTAQIVLGSRFHALIAALSQGVPCIGLGWSHKYEVLFQDYDCPQLLLTTSASEEHLRAALDTALQPESRGVLVRSLHRASEHQQQLTRDMWRKVDDVIGLEQDAAGPAECIVASSLCSVS